MMIYYSYSLCIVCSLNFFKSGFINTYIKQNICTTNTYLNDRPLGKKRCSIRTPNKNVMSDDKNLAIDFKYSKMNSRQNLQIG